MLICIKCIDIGIEDTMNTEIIILIIFAAFICEIIDSSLGMLYGTILSPSLIIAGFDPLIVVPSILLSQAVGSFIASIMHHRLDNAHFHINTNEQAPVIG
ncbi:MAG: hypothetical protein J7M01_03180, partial [Candidatus Marinimicrobia bacterium]|nr:hypothetical protein [Candidatus Neomarinimicrobiota bacterium]